MFKDIHTKRFHLTLDGRLEVYDNRLATRINRFLKVYDKGQYSFKEGEEAVFRLKDVSVMHSYLIKKGS